MDLGSPGASTIICLEKNLERLNYCTPRLKQIEPALKKMTHKMTQSSRHMFADKRTPALENFLAFFETFILLEIPFQNEYQVHMKATIGNVALRGHPRLPAYKRGLKLNCLKQEKATQTSTVKKVETNRKQGRSDHNNERGCKTTRR